MKNVTHRKLDPVVVPSSQPLAEVAPVKQHLAPPNPHQTAQTSAPIDKPNRCLRSGDLRLLDAFRYASESSGDLGVGTDEWSELLRTQEKMRLKITQETRKQRCQ